MKIGIDISVLQTPHRMRGIGYVLINFINSLTPEQKKVYKFTFFYDGESREDALEPLNTKELTYKLVKLHPSKKLRLRLPGRLNSLVNGTNQLIHLVMSFRGDSRIDKKVLDQLDCYLCFDQSQPLPRSSVKKGLILYDLIPLIMEDDYLWSYKTARKHGKSRKGALRASFHRKMYYLKTKANVRKSDIGFAISEHTRQDFINLLHIDEDKIVTVRLGVEDYKNQTSSDKLIEYKKSSWGYIEKPVELTKNPFLLFVGGADPRRKLIDLVAAFNNLRAEGKKIDLVLVGDTLKGPDVIPNIPIQKYFKSTSYLGSVHFLGFVNDEQKNWLYKHALAYVYPSAYEGFGLPILEAMRYECPVITYKNSSIEEVAGSAALFAEGYPGIYENVVKLLENPGLREDMIQKGKEQTKNFSWEKTTKSILDHLTS